MTLAPGRTCDVIVPVGALGAGVRAEDLARGISLGAHAIACDAGSTDSGPAYLATGRSKYSRDAVKADLAILMRAQAAAGIPLLIGSCGTSGCDMALDWMHDIAVEIARENGLSPRIALLYSEQEASLLEERAAAGGIMPLAPVEDILPGVFAACDHIVALMGPEPYIEALRGGADIVLGGRTTDTAVIAAVPLMMGAGAGAAWHAGKTSECGGLCTVRSRDGGVIVRVGAHHFDVEPLATSNACTTTTVSAHMLYENSDPFRLTEPGGVLDVSAACYEALDDRIVRVSGSVFEPAPYTMKLEGASGGAFQTIMLVGIQDRRVLAEIPRFLIQMEEFFRSRLQATIGPRLGDYDVSLRAYGWNGVTGDVVDAAASVPREIGLMFVATAATQELATQIAKTCNPAFFHMPLNADQELPSYAFPFSPAEIERGQVYEFRLNHVVRVDDPLELVRIRYLATEKVSHAEAE
ncbi:acyclic terpene utilization AtuA family protein [Sphingomonas sp. PB4P5]|uniref:acyclic terpene utilization AtuA family protein n=1 Tax=Parasphingomonas puruogangriensis TaxID=3096155 RepID=UPI002FCC8ECA